LLLKGHDIRDLLFKRDGDPVNWLVISPILDLEGQLEDGCASIDLRLSTAFVVPVRSSVDRLDPQDESYTINKALYMDEVIVPIGEHFVLHPRQFALGQTLEWIHLPLDLSGYVAGRSTWGRDGLIIATATGVHPGWSGPLTLELTNVGEIPILLYPGLTYVQLFLHQTTKIEKLQEGDRSQFMGTTRPVSGKPHKRDLEMIRRWQPS